MTKYKAKFIVLEGIDGTGKTTTAQKLEEYYKSLGKKVFLYHEPYKFASFNVKEIINNFESEGKYISDFAVLNLMIASRDISINNILIPELETNDIVIADRYYYSTYAYQKEIIESTLNIFTNLFDVYKGKIIRSYPKPDKILFFAIDDFTKYQNSKSDKFEIQDLTKFKEIQRNYLRNFTLTFDLDDSILKRITVNQNEQPYFDFNQVLDALDGI